MKNIRQRVACFELATLTSQSKRLKVWTKTIAVNLRRLRDGKILLSVRVSIFSFRSDNV